MPDRPSMPPLPSRPRPRQRRRLLDQPAPTGGTAVHSTQHSVQETVEPRLLERFQFALSGAKELPIALPGRIRLLTHRFGALPLTLFNAHLVAYDRSFLEWHAWMRTLSAHDANLASIVFLKNMQLRHQFRRLVVAHRSRKAAQAIVGDTDLYTLEPIPLRQQVRVLDLAQRRTYVFQVATLEKIFLSALSYSYYGIADPCMPKNPYTNLPWALNQCIHIVQQMVQIRAARHQFLHPDLIAFAKAHYNTRHYLETNAQQLHLRAATVYFANPLQPDAYIDYLDALGELYTDYVMDCDDGSGLMRILVGKRMLLPEHMVRWDAVVYAFWIWKNHGFFPANRNGGRSWMSLRDILGEIRILHRDCLSWWRAQPRRILTRTAAAAATVTDDSEV